MNSRLIIASGYMCECGFRPQTGMMSINETALSHYRLTDFELARHRPALHRHLWPDAAKRDANQPVESFAPRHVVLLDAPSLQQFRPVQLAATLRLGLPAASPYSPLSDAATAAGPRPSSRLSNTKKGLASDPVLTGVCPWRRFSYLIP